MVNKCCLYNQFRSVQLHAIEVWILRFPTLKQFFKQNLNWCKGITEKYDISN